MNKKTVCFIVCFLVMIVVSAIITNEVYASGSVFGVSLGDAFSSNVKRINDHEDTKKTGRSDNNTLLNDTGTRAETNDLSGCDLVIGQGYVILKRYHGDASSLVIETADGRKITHIGDNAFEGCTTLTNVVIGNDIVEIGEYAFSGCTNLNTLTIGQSITSIGTGAFWGCQRLNEVFYNATNVTSSNTSVFSNAGSLSENFSLVVGENVKIIPDNLLIDCNALTSVSIGDSVTDIGADAFSGCTSLTEISIPDSVTNIGADAFSGCTSLTEISIPDSVMCMGSGVFSDCTSLTRITISKSVSTIDESLFSGCSSLNRIDIPDGVTSIGISAFFGCSSLTEVSVPDNVTSIGDSAFSGCSSLTEISIPDNVTSIEGSTFSNCLSLKNVYIGNSVTSIGMEAFSGCTSLTEIRIPDSVANIEYAAFSGCSALTGITLGEGISIIEGEVFSGCTNVNHLNYHIKNISAINRGVFSNVGNLESGFAVVICDSVESIPAFLFENCVALNNVIIENGVTIISEGVFSGCINLTQINIPDSVTSIGTNAFLNCSSITEVEIPQNINTIDVAVFSGCTNLSQISIPNGVTSIGASAFSDCSSLTTITIPHNVTSIGYKAFYNCTALKEITIPANVTSIGGAAFSGCSSLLSIDYNAINISNSYTSNSNVFKDAGNIEEGVAVIIGNEVEEIPKYLFYNCSAIRYLTIGNSITSIGNCAFAGCTGLTDVSFNARHVANNMTSSSDVFKNAGIDEEGITVVFGNDVEIIPEYLFYNCSAIRTLIIGRNVTSIGLCAFSGCTGLTNLEYNAVNVTNDLRISYVFRDIGIEGDGVIVIVGNEVESIPAYLFSNCSAIRELIIGRSVTSIGDSAFSDCTGLISIEYNAIRVTDDMTSKSNVFRSAGAAGDGFIVVLGNEVENIPAYLFYDCSSLQSITFGECVTNIGDSAFSNCSNLIEINLPANVVTLGDFVFSNCYNLKSINIPDGVTTIGRGTFTNCSNLMKICIPQKATSIGGQAFSGCSGLTEITIPEEVSSIGDYAFLGCTGLNKINYNAINAVTNSVTGGLYVFKDVGNVEHGITLVFGDAVESIPQNLFHNCTALRVLTIGESVASIGTYAFYGCTGLTNIYYNAVNAGDLAWNASVFNNAGSIDGGIILEIGDKVKSIPAYLFSDCSSLSEIKWGPSLSNIGDHTFSNCDNLTQIIIPANVEHIGDSAFSSCSNMTSITVEALSIGKTTFKGCEKLSEITVGKNVASIEDEAFCGCTNLSKVKYNAINAADLYYTSKVFENSGNTELGITVTFGEEVKSIPSCLFYGNSTLKTIMIGKNVTNIGDRAFYACINLERIDYNAVNVVSSNQNVFLRAGSSGPGINVNFGASVKRLPENMFCGNGIPEFRPKIISLFFTGKKPIFDSNSINSNTSIYGYYPYGDATWD